MHIETQQVMKIAIDKEKHTHFHNLSEMVTWNRFNWFKMDHV